MPALRQASATDLVTLTSLINRAYEVEKFFVDGDRVWAEDLALLMMRGVMLVGEDAGTVVACVYVEVRGDRAYFGLLSVDPARQGGGWGRRMIEAAEAHARAAGCRAMDLSVVNLRTELPPLYRHFGYEETGTAAFNDPRATRPCHFILMSKALTPSD